jgi:hypothetical protein
MKSVAFTIASSNRTARLDLKPGKSYEYILSQLVDEFNLHGSQFIKGLLDPAANSNILVTSTEEFWVACDKAADARFTVVYEPVIRVDYGFAEGIKRALVCVEDNQDWEALSISISKELGLPASPPQSTYMTLRSASGDPMSGEIRDAIALATALER